MTNLSMRRNSGPRAVRVMKKNDIRAVVSKNASHSSGKANPSGKVLSTAQKLSNQRKRKESHGYPLRKKQKISGKMDSSSISRDKSGNQVEKANRAELSDEDISDNDIDQGPSNGVCDNGNPDVSSHEPRNTSPAGQISQDVRRESIIPSVRQSLANRRLHSGDRNNNVADANNSTIIQSGGSNEINITMHNNLKFELLEAQRDKRAYAAAFMALKEQKQSLEKEMKKLKQENLALESALDTKRVGRKGRKPVWSQENLKGTNIDAFQGICLAAGSLAKKEAIFVTTETYWDSATESRRRNWLGSAKGISSDLAERFPLNVTFPDGTFAVPHCNMLRALDGEDYNSSYRTAKEFANHCLATVMQGPVGSLMEESEKRVCINKILCHKETIQKFRGILSDSLGNRKKSSFQVYLRTLGYKNGAKSNSKHLNDEEKVSRKRERDCIYDRSITFDADGNIDTMSWRISSWSLLHNRESRTISDSLDADSNEEEKDVVDNLFMTKAAKRAFLCLRGYNNQNSTTFVENESIIPLVRADAYMTTMLKWVKVGGKGGVRNCDIRDYYKTLLPKAMEAIVKDIWDDINGIAPLEMNVHLGNSADCRADPYGNNLREWTTVTMNADETHLLLVAKPYYILKMVCSWMRDVKDCHIGYCRKDETKFTRIDVNINVETIEESDIDLDENLEQGMDQYNREENAGRSSRQADADNVSQDI